MSRSPKTCKILTDLGLTSEEVRAAFGIKKKEKPPEKKGYLFRPDQQRMIQRMKKWDGLVYARFEQGMHPRTIAQCLGVSEETVRVRLRKSGFFDRAESTLP